jgi:hypothetical protein
MPKQSRLVRKYPVRISNGKNKIAATIWNPDTKSVQKMTIWIPDSPVFSGLLYTGLMKAVQIGLVLIFIDLIFSRSLLRCKLIGVRTPIIYLADIDRGLLILEYLEAASTCRDFIKSLWKDKDNQVCINIPSGWTIKDYIYIQMSIVVEYSEHLKTILVRYSIGKSWLVPTIQTRDPLNTSVLS